MAKLEPDPISRYQPKNKWLELFHSLTDIFRGLRDMNQESPALDKQQPIEGGQITWQINSLSRPSNSPSPPPRLESHHPVLLKNKMNL